MQQRSAWARVVRRHAGSMAAGALTGLLAFAGPSAAAVPAVENGRFHHVHMNVADAAATTAFYGKVFGTVPVRYNGRQPALMADRSFIFLNQTHDLIASPQLTGLLHIGWGGVDGPSEFAGLQAQGIAFYTPLTRFLSGHFMYLLGPDHEVVEIWTDERNHRFNHVHLLSANPKATAAWFVTVTNPAAPPVLGSQQLGNWNVSFGDVTLHVLPDIPIFHPKERTGPFQPTDGAALDHLAFSFRDLDAAYRRIKAAGIPIVRPIRTDPQSGAASFFVRSPEGVLVELIKAKPLPDAAWE